MKREEKISLFLILAFSLFFFLPGMMEEEAPIYYDNWLVTYINVAGQEERRIFRLPEKINALEVRSGDGVYWMEVVYADGRKSAKVKEAVIDIVSFHRVNRREADQFYFSRKQN